MFKWTLILCIVFQLCFGRYVKDENEGKTTFNKIVGLFEATEGGPTEQMRAFNESMRHKEQLEPQPYTLKRNDSFSVFNELCSDKSMRTVAVFGPQNPITDGGVLEHCFKLHIPFIQAAWQPLDPDLEELENASEEETEETEEPTFKKVIINFYPDPNELAMAYAEVLKFYNWENFVVLYEDNYGLLRVQKILAEHSKNFPIIVRRLDPEDDNFEILKELKGLQESRILIDCHERNIKKYLEAAEQLNMLNPYQHYIFTSMDATKMVETLSNYQSNFTWLTLTDFDSLTNPQHFLAARVGWWTNDPSPRVTDFGTEALIMNDVANHLMKSLESAGVTSGKYLCPAEDDDQEWEFGANLQNKILETETSGVTGKISFDRNGRRTNYFLYINEICSKKMQSIGTWDSNTGTIEIAEKHVQALRNQTSSKKFYVMSRMAEPYFQIKKPCEEEPCEEDEYPDEQYEGFSVDLVRSIFKVLKEDHYDFSYEFIAEEGISYGVFDPLSKKWNGLIGKLLDKPLKNDFFTSLARKGFHVYSKSAWKSSFSTVAWKEFLKFEHDDDAPNLTFSSDKKKLPSMLPTVEADLVVCDLTITEARKKLVDFSVPIMTLGISILFTNDVKVPPEILSFLHPYTWETWVYTATAYCGVSILLFFCSRISPADWENPQPCDKDPEELENIWNFKNCTWLTMGSIMTQGCDILPKAFGSRWICGMWWFFALIFCQTYIAQLAASMTTAMESAPIESVEDLAKQTKVLYGAFATGSTLDFFKKSSDKMYHKMYENMLANPGVLVASNEEGANRVLSSNKYAFFMESATLEYKQKRNCKLKKVGGELDSKDYGIAMPANSPYRSTINRAILKLKENNKLNDIKDKWWNTKFGAKTCPDTKDANDVEGDLEMENLIGAFLVLIGGLFICLFITAAEFLNEVRNIVVREEVPYKEVFIKELKASLNFFQLQKPILRNPSRAPSIASSEKSNKSKMRAQLVTNFLEFEKEPQ